MNFSLNYFIYSVFLQLILLQYFKFVLTSPFNERERFMPKVEWECSDKSIQILVKTIKPFFGIIKPKGIIKQQQNSSPCLVQGNGDLITKMEIPLLEGGWKECGLNFEKVSSTLWTQIEIHEHILLYLHDDRLVNISCAGWAETLNKQQKKEGENNDFQLVFHHLINSNNNKNNYLEFGKPYKLVLFGATKQNKKFENNWWLIHSCSVSSIDNSVRIELIDSNGCSIDQKLISNFQMQTTINPSLGETFSLNSSQILTTKTVLASAFIPSIFKIDSESTTINGDLLKFECLIDPCNGKEIPCNFPQRDCETKTIKTTTQNILIEKENEEDNEEESFKQQEAENELELVTTQLLFNNENKENLKQNITNNLFSSTSRTTTSTLSPFLINSSNFDEFSNPNFSFNFDSSIEKRQRNQHLMQIIAHVHDKQEKINEELNGINDNLKANNSSNSDEKLIISTTNIENQSKPLFLPIKTSRLRTHPSSPPLIEQTNISLESTTQQNIEENNTYSTLFEKSSSPNYLSTSSYLCSTNNCISQNQLIQIFWICIFLCFIFVFGCFCNLLVCCFGNRKNERNNQNSGKWQKYEKKGKGRIVIGQQKLISSVNPQHLNCPPYNSNDTINKQKKQPESTDLWISSNGVSFNERIAQVNGGECLEMESSHFGPITSNTTSIYGALPIHNPQGNTPSNRRCSMLSYASVKAPIHSTIGGRCSNSNIIQNQIPASRIFASSQNQQNNKNIRSTSPSSLHSPSTTNTSSSGGNGIRETAGDAYHPNHHLPQQPQLQTFLQQSPNHQQLQQQQPFSILASSSIRSSTLGTPSDIEDQQTGTSTPRPSMDFGTTQKHQQANTNQHIIYDQNQSSPGVALQNYLTKTIIAGGPDKHESSSFF